MTSIQCADKTYNASAFLFLILGLFLQAAFGPPSVAAENPLFAPYTKVVLDNGLTIIVKEIHSVPIAAVDIRVAVGAVNDSPEEAGISLYVEHMLFKGTERRGVGEIGREIKAVGGFLNATTSMDATNYHVALPSEYIDLALDVEADAIRHSSFDPEEIERERKVILEEITMYLDRPYGIVEMTAMMAALFAGTPYTKNVIGNQDSLNTISRESLLAYYRKYYVPNNMVIAVAGDVETVKIIDRLTELFESMVPGNVETAPKIQLRKLEAIRRIDLEKEVSQSYLYFGFPAPPLKDEDSAALGIVSILLGGCKSARLNELYGKRLVHNVGAGYTQYRDLGMFEIYAETQDPSSVERRVRSTLKRIMDDGVTEDEVSHAKTVFYGLFLSNTERALSRAFYMSTLEINGAVEDGDEYVRRIRAVTVEDVQRAVREYVHPERYALLSVRPKRVNR